MRTVLLCGAWLAVLGALPGRTEAQLVRAVDDCCRTCRLQHCTCTTLQPVVETRFRQEQVVTYRDLKQTGYRQEVQYETVPVVRLDTVTVDEGGYQTVWVPKPVTRSVLRTDYEQRLSLRTVPVDAVQRVPEVTTRLVPEQTVRYVPHQTQTVISVLPSAAGGPTAGASPGTAAASMGPTPDPRFAETDSPLSTVSARRKLRPYRPEEFDQPLPAHPAATPPRSGRPVPSAATVWQSRR